MKGATVTAKVEKQGKEKKIVIFKYKPKKGSTRRKQCNLNKNNILEKCSDRKKRL